MRGKYLKKLSISTAVNLGAMPKPGGFISVITAGLFDLLTSKVLNKSRIRLLSSSSVIIFRTLMKMNNTQLVSYGTTPSSSTCMLSKVLFFVVWNMKDRLRDDWLFTPRTWTCLPDSSAATSSSCDSVVRNSKSDSKNKICMSSFDA